MKMFKDACAIFAHPSCAFNDVSPATPRIGSSCFPTDPAPQAKIDIAQQELSVETSDVVVEQ